MVTSTEVVLFDIGGVLIRLAGVDAWKKLIGIDDEAEVWRRWLHCPVVKEFERGNCSSHDFSTRMVEEHNLSLEPQDFLAAFKSWPSGFYEGAQKVVSDVVDHVRVGCFSNTSDVHWETQTDNQELKGLFDIHFLSHKMGMVKPDAESFHHVIEELSCAAEAILFLDDNIINVDAARACGINAHIAKEPSGARSVLESHGLLK